jgi:hypothetical protein
VGAQHLINDIIELLKLFLEDMMPSGHIGQGRPGRKQDLPTIAVSIGEIKESPIGIGGMIGIQREEEDQWIEKRGSRISGLLFIEVWATDKTEAMGIANALFQSFEDSKKEIRERGFIQFAEREIRTIEDSAIDNHNAVKMVTVYSVTYETVAILEPEEGVISQVHVKITDGFTEEMDLSN